MWTCPECGREFKRANQNHVCGAPPATVDAYIQRQSEAVRPTLVRLRETIRAAIPQAAECIAWGMPTWKRKGNLIHFAVSKRHIGVYVDREAAAFFGERLTELGLEFHKGAIHLPLTEEPPFALIGEIAAWSYEQEI